MINLYGQSIIGDITHRLEYRYILQRVYFNVNSFEILFLSQQRLRKNIVNLLRLAGLYREYIALTKISNI